MALLSPSDQQTLRDMFADMTRQVTIVFVTQTFGCETCEETKRILGELTPLTDRIVVEEVNLVLDKERAAGLGIDRAPAMALLADGEDTRVRFLGAPAGYDFMALVDAILAVSGASDSELSAESLALIASVTVPTRIQVFVTPTCAYCPRAVGLAVRMAAANPHITATTVQATEFYDLARQYRVTGVPKTVVNDEIEILGALPEPDFIRAALAIDDEPPPAAGDGTA
jgi:glutaredoxin-like protein